MRINLLYSFIFFALISFVIGCSKNDEIMLAAYECEKKGFLSSNLDLLNCSGNCKKIALEDEDDKKLRDTKFTFGLTANKESSKVLYRIYKNKEVILSEVFENCKIFDIRNWDCSSEEKFMNTRTINNVKMNNGIFVNHQERRYFQSKSMEQDINYAFCGK